MPFPIYIYKHTNLQDYDHILLSNFENVCFFYICKHFGTVKSIELFSDPAKVVINFKKKCTLNIQTFKLLDTNIDLLDINLHILCS